MGRKANPPRAKWEDKPGHWRLRFTFEGVRHDYRNATIPKRDTAAAARWSNERQQAVFSGEWRRELEQGTDHRARLVDVGAAYLAEVIGGAISTRTGTLRKDHLRVHLVPVFPTLDAITPASLATYQNERLKVVKYATIKKELSTLSQVLKFAVLKGWIPEVPKFPGKPGKSLGTKHKNGSDGFTTGFTQEMALAILAALPELTRADRKTGIRWPFRAYFILLAETGLRPGTIADLRKGVHWRSGSALLNITADIDKNKFARTVPLTPAAVAALESATAQPDGQMFRAKEFREPLRTAAAKAGVPLEIAARVKPYDFRHARTTDLVNTGMMLGAGFMVGHLQATTTNRYSHSNEKQAAQLVAKLAANDDAAKTDSGAGSGADSGAEAKRPPGGLCDPAPEALLFSCAKERTRTSTRVTPPAPQGGFCPTTRLGNSAPNAPEASRGVPSDHNSGVSAHKKTPHPGALLLASLAHQFGVLPGQRRSA